MCNKSILLAQLKLLLKIAFFFEIIFLFCEKGIKVGIKVEIESQNFSEIET